MKDKILIFIIGLLVGAVITASGFLIYEKTNKSIYQMPNKERMQTMERLDGETPPEKPSETENDRNRQEPPSKNNSTLSKKTNEGEKISNE